MLICDYIILMKLYDIEGLSDSHFHILEMLKKDIDVTQVIDNWINTGGDYLIDIGVDEKDFELRQKYSDLHSFIYHSVGIHPNSADEKIDERLISIENSIKDSVVAIGETGLDYYWDTVDKNIQIDSFIKHIKLSIKYNLPLIIHNRDACEDILNILKKYSGKISGIIHCFSSTDYYLKEFIKLGFYISYAGNLTYKKNIKLQETLTNVPLDKLLIETDSPYLTPVPLRGKPNNPIYIGYTFNYIADYLNINRDELKQHLKKNLETIFKLREDS